MGYGNNPYVAKFACEFIGTMMLVCVVQLASSQQRDLAPIAIGLVLMNMIYCLGHISGAHFNPAVTIAILVRNIPQFPRHDTFNVFGYFISQYLGGICGGLLSWSIGGHDTAYHWPHVQDSPTASVKGREIWYVFQGEFVFTFLLAFVVLNVATDQRISNNQFYGVAIGTTLMLAAFAIGPISGCIINPAVWVGTVSIASAAAKGHEPIYVYHFYAFWLAHLAGGTLAGVVYNTFIKNSLSDGKALEPETFEVAPDENAEAVSDNATTDVEMR